jgi:hypothetical protein
MSPLKTMTITVQVNTQYGTVSFTPPSPIMAQAGEVRLDLNVTGAGAAGVRAYVGLVDHSKLAPNGATLADGFQDVVFAFQDSGGNELQPTFETQTAHGPVALSVAVGFPAGSPFTNYPVNSVVIVDW